MMRLFLTRRWLGYFAVAIVFALACSAFGIWQWNRRVEALAAIDRLRPLRADLFAVRGAACVSGDRLGSIDSRRVAALVRAHGSAKGADGAWGWASS